MNARTVRKRLYKGGQRVLWGRRAYAEVRLPPQVFSTPPVPHPGPPEGCPHSSCFDGEYHDHEDIAQALRIVSVKKVSGTYEYSPLVVPGTLSDDGGWGQWWEASVRTRNSPKEIFKEAPFRDPWVQKYLSYHAWKDQAYNDVAHPVLARFGEASNYARSVSIDVGEDGYVYILFGVKYFYPRTLRRFSAHFSRGFRLAKKMGLEVRAKV